MLLLLLLMLMLIMMRRQPADDDNDVHLQTPGGVSDWTPGYNPMHCGCASPRQSGTASRTFGGGGERQRNEARNNSAQIIDPTGSCDLVCAAFCLHRPSTRIRRQNRAEYT
jgi:hypothetical protein